MYLILASLIRKALRYKVNCILAKYYFISFFLFVSRSQSCNKYISEISPMDLPSAIDNMYFFEFILSFIFVSFLLFFPQHVKVFLVLALKTFPCYYSTTMPRTAIGFQFIRFFGFGSFRRIQFSSKASTNSKILVGSHDQIIPLHRCSS